MYQVATTCQQNVAPRVGAWIETEGGLYITHTPLSHPVWVRGLKHHIEAQGLAYLFVAPRVGAWIETKTLSKQKS